MWWCQVKQNVNFELTFCLTWHHHMFSVRPTRARFSRTGSKQSSKRLKKCFSSMVNFLKLLVIHVEKNSGEGRRGDNDSGQRVCDDGCAMESTCTSNDNSLVVFATGLSLSIEDTTPVISLKICLVIYINLDLNRLSLRFHRVCWHTSRFKESTNKLSKT